MTIIDELNQLEHNENTPTKHDLFPFFIAGNSLSIESKRSNPIGLGPFRHPKSLVDKLLRPSPTNLLIPKYKELETKLAFYGGSNSLVNVFICKPECCAFNFVL